ncbi:MAG: FAD-binding protein [Actinobacteria bacterium]|jgi:glycolate oxidase|nr:MAG: FAD-binding protein [Actinomycetota bacterium]
MRLKEEAYRVLESIVGEENISRDPAVLDGYAWQFGCELYGPEDGAYAEKAFAPSAYLEETGDEASLASPRGSRFGFRPVAVVLPADTAEVQAIVKACNRYGIKFKAHSTGWGPWSGCGTAGMVQMDLRRMNRILEINEEDMYAVIEPYVVWSTLQAETMKRGLNCVTIGAGGNCSALASITSFNGIGYNNYSMGLNERNVLGVEWVLPDGEVLRLGSLGSGAGWFSGDGPGPSLRGVMRGEYGAAGGLGVFTRIAAKLYQWGGPTEMPVENIDPAATLLKEFPENCALYYPFFETAEDRDRALWMLGENEVGYSASFMGRGLLAWGLGGSNREASDTVESVAQTFPRYAFILVLVCNSAREFAYQQKVVERILEETGGQNFALIEVPEVRSMVALLLFKGGNKVNIVFQRSGAFFDPGLFTGSRRTFTAAEKLSIDVINKYIEKGLVVDDYGEGSWGSLFDYGHLTACENETMYKSTDPAACGAVIELLEDLDGQMTEHLFRLGHILHQQLTDGPRGKCGHDTMGPLCDGYQVWQRRIKRAFDPNTAADPTMYILPEET